MIRRKVIEIDESKCDGCGLCVPACAEGAIQIIDGKAKLISDRYCDGLGACLGDCPQGAITMVEKVAEEYDEEAVKVHLQQMFREKMANFSCPSAATMDFRKDKVAESTVHTHDRPLMEGNADREKTQIYREEAEEIHGGNSSMLNQWPVQLTLVSPKAPYFEDSELLVAADCVPFAYAGFHRDFLKGRSLVIGCPKLDDGFFYVEKLSQILKESRIKGIKVLTMEVPCCFGLYHIVTQAVSNSGREIPVEQITIGIRGDLK